MDDHRLLLDLDPIYAEIDHARRDAEHQAGLTHDNDCQQCLATRAAQPGAVAIVTFGGNIVRVICR